MQKFLISVPFKLNEYLFESREVCLLKLFANIELMTKLIFALDILLIKKAKKIKSATIDLKKKIPL